MKQLHLKQIRSDRLQLLLRPEFQSAGNGSTDGLGNGGGTNSVAAAQLTVGDANPVNVNTCSKDLAGNSPKPDNMKLVVANDTLLPDSDEETWALPGASP